MRPWALISASSDCVRSPSTIPARRMADSAPDRTSALSGTPRKDLPVAAQPTASSRLVLPCALAPQIAVTPGGSSTTAAV